MIFNYLLELLILNDWSVSWNWNRPTSPNYFIWNSWETTLAVSHLGISQLPWIYVSFVSVSTVLCKAWQCSVICHNNVINIYNFPQQSNILCPWSHVGANVSLNAINIPSCNDSFTNALVNWWVFKNIILKK